MLCFQGFRGKILDVQIADVECIVFDEDPAGFDHISHEDVEHASGLQCVVIVEFHLEEAASFRIHGRLIEFLGIHLAQTLESLDLHAPTTDFLDHLEDARDGEDLVGGLSVNDVEQRGFAVGVVFDLESLFGQFRDELLNTLGLMDFNQACTASACILIRLGNFLCGGAIFTFVVRRIGIEEVEIDILRGEVAEFGLVVEILDGLLVATADDDKV